jgi:hypothetical protein
MKTRPVHRAIAALARGATACALAVFATSSAGVQNAASPGASPYQRMAPLDEYLMPNAAEIALARSAAPAAVSANATILTLTSQGYQSVASGTNGFTCLVERAWMSPFDSAEFWNPKIRGPVCYNPAASGSILTYTLQRTKLALAGRTREQMLAAVRDTVAHQGIPEPLAGAMSFMMSKDGYLADAVVHWHPHLMFHVPKAAAASWGANLPGSPVVLDDRLVPEPETIFMVPVARWSDETAAPIM